MAAAEQKFRIRRALFPVGYYGTNSICQGYISLFYTQLGYTAGQLGMLHAATAASALLFQPLWGGLGDRLKKRNLLLAALSLTAAMAFPLKLVSHAFIWQLIVAALFYAFFSALLPLGDSILLTCGDSFGVYRLAGGVSFAVVGAAYGFFRPQLGMKGLWAVFVLLLFTATSALLLPVVPGEKKEKGRMRDLLKDKPLVMLLAFTLPLQMTMGYFYTFYAPRFKAVGGSDALLGLGYFISAASEAPYLIFSRRIYDRWGAAKPMCIASALLALRWLLLGLVENAWLLLAAQLLHGGGFIVVTVSMAYWISDHVGENLRSSGQALLNMVTFGLARISANLLGGWIAQVWSMEMGFIIGAGVCAAVGMGLMGALKSNYCISRHGDSMV